MLYDAAEEFSAHGIEGHILVNDTEDGVYAESLRSRGYVIHRIPNQRLGGHFLQFWRLCRREKFTAVHIHVIKGFAAFTFVARLAGVRNIVKTIHSVFDPAGCLRILLHTLRRHMTQLFGAEMVAISRSVQENERCRFHLQTHLIWNWADDAAFPLAEACSGIEVRRALHIDHNAFVLLTVGNCHSDSHYRIKNHRLLIEAIARLPYNIRKDVVYLHVGAEMSEMTERSLAASLGVQSNIRFLGSRTDVWQLLCASNEYVMTSLREGLSVSAIEAVLSGRRMILTDVPGLCDYKDIVPGVAYVPLSSPKDLAEMIAKRFHCRGVEDGDIAIRAAALKAFSMKIGVEEYAKMYGV